MKHYRLQMLIWSLAMSVAPIAIAQQPTASTPPKPQTDNKALLDERLYHLLMDSTVNHKEYSITIDRDKLMPMPENDYYRYRRNNLGSTVYNNDFFVRRNGKKYVPVTDAKHPLETVTNLLLGVSDASNRKANVTFHTYGNKSTNILLSLEELLDKLAHGRQLYCAITEVNDREVNAVLMAHDPVRDDLHMARVSVPVKQVANKRATFEVDLRGNIPQSNLKQTDNKASGNIATTH